LRERVDNRIESVKSALVLDATLGGAKSERKRRGVRKKKRVRGRGGGGVELQRRGCEKHEPGRERSPHQKVKKKQEGKVNSVFRRGQRGQY